MKDFFCQALIKSSWINVSPKYSKKFFENNRKIKMGQENVSGLQQRILVRSRVKISGDGDLEAICRRTLL